MIESGVPGYDIGVWFGLLAPAGTPASIVNKLHDELAEIIQLPDVREKMLVQGLEPTTNTPEEFAEMIKNEVVRWGKIVETAKVKPIN
jgi:tripartite-type tricarboxylate transporter receptor subunit TctC